MSDASPRSRSFPTLLLSLTALFAVSFCSLGVAGLIGPDEPRYASIGRAMAASGDWVTPRLWGAPWFEKPALLYWLVGAGHCAGLPAEIAARLPVALCAALFVGFLWWGLRKLGRQDEAPVAAVLLAASAGWMAVGNVAATDMPLAATFNAAVVAALLWLKTGQRRWAFAAGACLGLALLAKGLVGAVLFLPVLWFARKQWRGFLLLAAAAAVVAAPWYVAVTERNGFEFIRVFFLEHHLGRFSRPDLQHVQPFWFYVPVWLGLLFPWTPLLALARRSAFKEAPERVFAVIAVFGFLFFSASTNKLPGYLLPLLPAACVVLARAITGVRAAREPAPEGAEAPAPNHRRASTLVASAALACCALLLGLLPLAAAVLPEALHSGLRRVTWRDVPVALCLLAVPAGAAIYWMAKRRGMAQAVAALGLLTAAGWLGIKVTALPAVDQQVSARPLWQRVQARRDSVCVESLNRSLRYGLNYYSVTPLPDCAATPARYRIRQLPRHEAEIRDTAAQPSTN